MRLCEVTWRSHFHRNIENDALDGVADINVRSRSKSNLQIRVIFNKQLVVFRWKNPSSWGQHLVFKNWMHLWAIAEKYFSFYSLIYPTVGYWIVCMLPKHRLFDFFSSFRPRNEIDKFDWIYLLNIPKAFLIWMPWIFHASECSIFSDQLNNNIVYVETEKNKKIIIIIIGSV